MSQHVTSHVTLFNSISGNSEILWQNIFENWPNIVTVWHPGKYSEIWFKYQRHKYVVRFLDNLWKFPEYPQVLYAYLLAVRPTSMGPFWETPPDATPGQPLVPHSQIGFAYLLALTFADWSSPNIAQEDKPYQMPCTSAIESCRPTYIIKFRPISLELD